MSIEQINNTTGTTLYLHHDQAGSTRLLTSSTGKNEATFTYDAYGNTIGSTGTVKTPLGYDGQYTSTDTGLVHLRARTYDPKTAQFLSVDPLASITRAPYNYASDNPLNLGDPTGLWSPTESLEKFSNEVGEGISNVSGGLVNGLTGGLIEGSGNSCSTGYTIGQYASLVGALIPGEGEVLGAGDVVAGVIDAQGALRAAERWLGEGYREMHRVFIGRQTMLDNSGLRRVIWGPPIRTFISNQLDRAAEEILRMLMFILGNSDLP